MENNLEKVEVLTFDCYGTLIDWESGIRHSLETLRPIHGVEETVDQLLGTWEAIQFEMICGPYRRYRDILRDSLRETFEKVGVSLPTAEADSLSEQLGTWAPFSDTVESLRRLATRYKLGILSNIDDDLLAHSVEYLGVSFDELITAEQLRSYKPRPAHFKEAIRRFGRPAHCFLHCAFGFKYDQAPALDQGMSTAWIKRTGWIRDDVATPTYETDSLAGLVRLLGFDS